MKGQDKGDLTTDCGRYYPANLRKGYYLYRQVQVFQRYKITSQTMMELMTEWIIGSTEIKPMMLPGLTRE